MKAPVKLHVGYFRQDSMSTFKSNVLLKFHAIYLQNHCTFRNTFSHDIFPQYATSWKINLRTYFLEKKIKYQWRAILKLTHLLFVHFCGIIFFMLMWFFSFVECSKVDIVLKTFYIWPTRTLSCPLLNVSLGLFEPSLYLFLFLAHFIFLLRLSSLRHFIRYKRCRFKKKE